MFRLRFIHCTMVSPFILHCFPFSSTGEWKGKKSLKRCRWIVRLILITLCLWANSHVLDCIIHYNYYQARCCHVLIQVSQDGFMLRFICLLLGCDLLIQLMLKSPSSEYDDKLEDCFIMHRFTSQTMKYICNILCLIKLALCWPPTCAKYFMLHKVLYCAKI